MIIYTLDERWITFNEKFLSVSNENNNRDIGGHNSMRASKFEKDFDEAISYEKAVNIFIY